MRRGRKSSRRKPASISSGTFSTSSPPSPRAPIAPSSSPAGISIQVNSRLLAVQHGGTVETYRDTKLVTKQDENGEGGTLAFLEPGLVAIGTTTAVKKAIDAKLTATSVTSNDEIMTLVAQIEQSHNAWALGRFEALTSQANLPEQIAKQLPPVKWFTTGVHINGGVTGMVRVEATDEDAAELLRRQLNGALAFGEMMSRSDVRIATALKAIQLSGTGKTVQLSFTVPGELLQMVLPQTAIAADTAVTDGNASRIRRAGAMRRLFFLARARGTLRQSWPPSSSSTAR